MRLNRSRGDLAASSASWSGPTAYLAMTGLLLLGVLLLLLQPSQSLNTYAHPQPQHLKLVQPGQHDGEEEGRLLAVQAVFRHGARTPLNTIFWPESSYSDCHDTYPGPQPQLFDETGRAEPPPILDLDMPPLPGGCRMGQLTHVGHDMAIQLGSWLRERYVDGPPSTRLLPSTFSPETMALRSTCIQRAVLTLQGVLAGLYPDLQGPVNVAASLEQFEFEYGKNTTCPALGPLLEQLQSLVVARDVNNKELKRLARVVRLALGLAPAETLDWVHLRDSLAAMQAESIPLPQGADKDVMAIIEQQAVRHESAVIGPTPQDGLVDEGTCRKVIAMSVGPLVDRLISNMHRAMGRAAVGARGGADERRRGRGRAAMAAGAGGDASPLMHVYSGHDSTITPLLVALGQPETEWPPFTASLVFELWEKSLETAGGKAGAGAAGGARRAAAALGEGGKGAGVAALGGRKDPAWGAGKGAGARGEAGGVAGAAAVGAAQYDGRYSVRVLYDRQVMKLRNSRPGGFLDLRDFERLVKPYALSDQAKADTCSRVPSAKTGAAGAADML